MSCALQIDICVLTCREQRVKMNGVLSDTLCTSFGSPQGCVLSSILFLIYTNECQSYEDNYYVVKYAHNTVFLSLLSCSKCDDSRAIVKFITWCNKA